VEIRRIGALEVSALGLGCNQFGRNLDLHDSRLVINAALDAGITFFDTADVYGAGLSEEYLGQALRPRRSRAIIATKFGNPTPGEAGGASPAYLRRAVEASLTRLGTDYIDLYQLHAPDPATPIDETLGALNELVGAGKIRAFGCSNFSREQLASACARGTPWTFVAAQNEYSILQRQADFGLREVCRENGLALIPYFPLAGGLLTGKYARSKPGRLTSRLVSAAKALKTPENEATVAQLSAFAAARGRTMLELAFGWLLAREPVASVIAGATTVAQIEANRASIGWALSDDDLANVDRIAPAKDTSPTSLPTSAYPSGR
jgi:aryl-alcohol dehydrogenase-like predicted oxidoreductase